MTARGLLRARPPGEAGAVDREPVGSGWVLVQPDGGWCLDNVGLVRTGGALVVVDTMANARRNDHLLAVVDDLRGDREVVTVNTHFHGDHTFGNDRLARRGPVVSTATTADLIDASGTALCGIWPASDWGDITVRRPDVLVGGDGEVPGTGGELLHLELRDAHTPSDLALWDPARRVLYAGDVVMSGVTPFVLMGSVRGCVAALERLAGLGAEVVVPGHGAVGGPGLIARNLEYLRWCLGLADDAVRAGLTPLEAAHRAGPHPWDDWVDRERLVGNLHAATAEVQGRPPDLAAALADMAAFGPDSMTNGIEPAIPPAEGERR